VAAPYDIELAGQLSDRAVELSMLGDVEEAYGRLDAAAKLYHEAFEIGERAADAVASLDAPEPDRSVYHRSGAALAAQAGKYEAAEKLIQRGLQGDPPFSIKTELEELLGDLPILRTTKVNLRNLPPSPRLWLVPNRRNHA